MKVTWCCPQHSLLHGSSSPTHHLCPPSHLQSVAVKLDLHCEGLSPHAFVHLLYCVDAHTALSHHTTTRLYVLQGHTAHSTAQHSTRAEEWGAREIEKQLGIMLIGLLFHLQ